jgi:hypothetical protein
MDAMIKGVRHKAKTMGSSTDSELDGSISPTFSASSSSDTDERVRSWLDVRPPHRCTLVCTLARKASARDSEARAAAARLAVSRVHHAALPVASVRFLAPARVRSATSVQLTYCDCRRLRSAATTRRRSGRRVPPLEGGEAA